MQLPANRFKASLASGKKTIGLWSNLASPLVAEALTHTDFDWMTIDMEHGPNTLSTVVSQLQVLVAGDLAPIVRPPWNDRIMIKQLLDAGANSLIIPYVQNADEAREAVAATRYPPHGVRGVAGGSRATLFGTVADYHANAHKEIAVIVQAETPEAISNIPAIAAVDGVDGIFIGPADLAASMGHLGKMNHPDVQARISEALAAIHAAGKPAGILAFDQEKAADYLEQGFDFVCVGSDQSILMRGATQLALRFDAIRGK